MKCSGPIASRPITRNSSGPGKTDGGPANVPTSNVNSPRMKTTIELGYKALLANTAQPVPLVLKFEAPELLAARARPCAFAVVVDRSGSMNGAALDAAKAAARTVVRNLRPDDLFSFVAFDNEAQTLLPLAKVTSREQAYAVIDRLQAHGSTNLTGGWLLGRDQLRTAPADALKRLLLLTDGCLNVGITDPVQVSRIVSGGQEADGIRTSALGFSNSYNEDLLSSLAHSTGGTFYDANRPERLPEIFAAELDGLQKTVVVNLRVRLKTLDFVEHFVGLGDYPQVKLPDGRIEVQLGDLVSSEQRIAVFELDVLPMPLIAAGQPAATLDGEALMDVEIVYDEVSDVGLTSHGQRYTVRVRPTQDPADVVVNTTVLPWVTAQQAAAIWEKTVALREAGDIAGARAVLDAGIARMTAYGRDAETADALRLLKETRDNLLANSSYQSTKKSFRYHVQSLKRMRSTEHWVGEGPAPSFMKRDPKDLPGEK